jgi:hypothetical protein
LRGDWGFIRGARWKLRMAISCNVPRLVDRGGGRGKVGVSDTDTDTDTDLVSFESSPDGVSRKQCHPFISMYQADCTQLGR